MQAAERQQLDNIRSLHTSASKLKQKLQDILLNLETQRESCDWPKYLNTLGLCASELIEIQKVLQSERFSTAQSSVLTPILLNPEPDLALAKATEERLVIFNHDTAPQYLRTKLDPSVDALRITQDARGSTIPESAIKVSNRLLDSCLKDIAILKQELDQDLSDKATTPNSLKSSSSTSMVSNPTDDLFTMVAAMTVGKGLGSRLSAAKSDAGK